MHPGAWNPPGSRGRPPGPRPGRGPGGPDRRCAAGVAQDRRISVTDPEMRQGVSPVRCCLTATQAARAARPGHRPDPSGDTPHHPGRRAGGGRGR